MIKKRMVPTKVIAIDSLEDLVRNVSEDNRVVSRAINDIVREVNRNEKRARRWRIVEIIFGVITVRDLLIHGKELRKLGIRLENVEDNVLSIKAKKVIEKEK